MLAGKSSQPRTYRIAGPQRQIDERETPHPRVDRGELGAKLRDWRKSRMGADPFRRVFGGGGQKEISYNSLYDIYQNLPEGKVNPDKIPVADPEKMARNIKEIARFFGADAVGTHLDQAYVYSHRARGNAVAGEKRSQLRSKISTTRPSSKSGREGSSSDDIFRSFWPVGAMDRQTVPDHAGPRGRVRARHGARYVEEAGRKTQGLGRFGPTDRGNSSVRPRVSAGR